MSKSARARVKESRGRRVGGPRLGTRCVERDGDRSGHGGRVCEVLEAERVARYGARYVHNGRASRAARGVRR
jgi:hypothetical protein